MRYASVDNLKLIHRNGWPFFATLKSNGIVILSKEQGYVHLHTIKWSEKTLQMDIMVKLKGVPFLMKLFNEATQQIVFIHGYIDWGDYQLQLPILHI